VYICTPKPRRARALVGQWVPILQNTECFGSSCGLYAILLTEGSGSNFANSYRDPPPLPIVEPRMEDGGRVGTIKEFLPEYLTTVMMKGKVKVPLCLIKKLNLSVPY
jgi:hypothetical protein